MDHIFGKYRLATPLSITSPNPAHLARSSFGPAWSIVVKIYPMSLLHLPEEEEAFLHEMETRKQLQHLSLLPLLDYGIEKGVPYSVTSYIAGGSLRDLINHTFPLRLTPQRVMQIIVHVGQALHYVHEHHIVHGNMKPENILFDEHDNALLSDFQLFITVLSISRTPE
jgi:serine/threonine-protein kinase